MEQIIEYYDSRDKQHWLEEIGKSDWQAGKLLYNLIRDDKLKGLCGENTKVLLLVEDDKLLSFCTYAEQDEIDRPDIKPWIGFVYTFPEYRGRHLFGKLLEKGCNMAKEDGYKTMYISTDAEGLYEKYGFSYWTTMQSIYEWKSRVYRRKL